MANYIYFQYGIINCDFFTFQQATFQQNKAPAHVSIRSDRQTDGRTNRIAMAQTRWKQ